MLLVRSAVSGEVVAHLEEVNQCIRVLKTLLAKKIGVSRFRQKWFNEEGCELLDDTLMLGDGCVQLLVLDFRPLEEGQSLIFACAQNSCEEVERLLQQCASPQTSDQRGRTALHVAVLGGHLLCLELLLEANAALDKKDSSGFTALHLAAEHGHSEAMQLLLEAGADKNCSMRSGATALHVGASKGCVDVVWVLLKAGVEIDQARTDNGATALILAALFGHSHVVRLLLSFGAARDTVRTDTGKTAFQEALLNQHHDVVQLLAEADREFFTDGEQRSRKKVMEGRLGVLK